MLNDKNNHVPFVNLSLQFKSFKKEVLPKWNKILKSGIFLSAKETESFEKNLAIFCNTKYAKTVASGTDAILLSLLATNIGKNDEVITTSHTFVSSAISILRVGAKPAFVDIDPSTYCIDPKKIEEKITKKTKAIMPIHLYGQSCDMEQISKIAKKNKLTIIQDACQAIGANFQGKSAISYGDISALSFYPTKNLASFSDAGAILTNTKSLYLKVKNLADYGFKTRYISKKLGYNSRVDELQAVWLNALLKLQNQIASRRRFLANRYIEKLKHLPIILPYSSNPESHVYNMFVILTPKRDALKKFLEANNITALIHYPVPIHKQPAFKQFSKISLPASESIAKKVLSLPIYPQMTEKQQDHVCQSINQFFKK